MYNLRYGTLKTKYGVYVIDEFETFVCVRH